MSQYVRLVGSPQWVRERNFEKQAKVETPKVGKLRSEQGVSEEKASGAP